MRYVLPSAPYKQMTVSNVAQSTHLLSFVNNLNWFKPCLNVISSELRIATDLRPFSHCFENLGIDTVITVRIQYEFWIDCFVPSLLSESCRGIEL